MGTWRVCKPPDWSRSCLPWVLPPFMFMRFFILRTGLPAGQGVTRRGHLKSKVD